MLFVSLGLSVLLLTFGVEILNKLEVELLKVEENMIEMDVSNKSIEFQRGFSKMRAKSIYTVKGDFTKYQDSTGHDILFQPTEEDKEYRKAYNSLPIVFKHKKNRMRVAGLNWIIILITSIFLFWRIALKDFRVNRE